MTLKINCITGNNFSNQDQILEAFNEFINYLNENFFKKGTDDFLPKLNFNTDPKEEYFDEPFLSS